MPFAKHQISEYSRQRINVSAYGVVGDGKTDNSLALQKIINAIPDNSPTSLEFPPGEYAFKWPVFVDKEHVNVVGAGRAVTTLKNVDYATPILVFGIRQNEVNNQSITDKNRPDVFGVLDGSIVNRPGLCAGFSTQGNAYAMATANPAQIGRIVESRIFDYYGQMPGLTVEIALRIPGGVNSLPINSTIIGLGDPYSPGPWWFGLDAERRLTLTFRTSDMTVDHSSPSRVARFRVPDLTAELLRIHLWVDHTTGELGCFVNGVNVTAEATSNIDNFKGLKFAKNRGQYPFWIGPSPYAVRAAQDSGPVANYDILGFKVSAVAKRQEASNDKERYVGTIDNPDAVVWLDGTCVNGKYLPLGCGLNTGVPGCVALILTTNGTYGGIKGNSVSNLTIRGGSPAISIGYVLQFYIDNCNFVDGFLGIGSALVGMNYPITISNTVVSGWDAGLSLGWCFVRLFGVDVDGGGICCMRFIGAGVAYYSGFFGRFSELNEVGLDFIADEAGGSIILMDLYFDNESSRFYDSVIRADNQPYGPKTSLYARNICVAIMKDTKLFRLRGQSTSKALGVLDIGGIMVSPETPASDIVANEGGWKVLIDGTTVPNGLLHQPPS